MTRQKIEVIISRSEIIFEAIENNLARNDSVSLVHIDHDYEKFINSSPKIDLIILDDIIDSKILLNHVKTIVNLRDFKYTSDDILLNTPFRLAELLQIVKNCRDRNQIFCSLNNNWIYDEQSSKLFNQIFSIRFTEKENEVFKYLILAKENRITKEELYRVVWQYHPDSSSATIEMHMSRLKQKLPMGCMQVKDNYYELIVGDIV